MRRTWCFLALLPALSCGRCEKGTAVDAGAARWEHRTTDLRSALVTLYPEFRGATVTGGFAQLSRELEWSGESLQQAALAKGFQPPDGGAQGVIGVREPFTLLEERKGERWVETLRVELGEDEVGRLFQSPSPLSTEVMAAMLPMPEGARGIQETFLLSLDYTAREERTDFLVHQLVDLLVAGNWRVKAFPEGWQQERREDGGVGAVPPAFEMAVVREQPPAEVRIKRAGPRVVHLELIQPTAP